jgi:hypothetical protein
MKPNFSHLDKFRIPHPSTGYIAFGDRVGAFQVPCPTAKQARIFIIIAADGSDDVTEGWEHVSVHGRKKHNGKTQMFTPSWEDMCFIKGLFWDAHEPVIQFHPPKSQYVNIHQHVLHLWSHPNAISLPKISLV